ncbi:MAG: coproporphyrinogen-III oxidase family protein, partial [Clostridia bacterium]
MTINKPVALYIHIPFCVSRCEYCDFVSNTCIDRIDDYITALTSEITRNVDKFKDRKVSSVYFGGGTPSLISSEQFLRVFSAVKLYNIADNAEITVECNPESVTKEKLDTYKHCGVNRVSVGVQSCIDTQLKTIGRAHSYEDVTRALDLIFDSGFSNVSCDIMLGLPDETRKTVEITLDKIFAYPLTHLSAYSLILEKGTKLYN